MGRKDPPSKTTRQTTLTGASAPRPPAPQQPTATSTASNPPDPPNLVVPDSVPRGATRESVRPPLPEVAPDTPAPARLPQIVPDILLPTNPPVKGGPRPRIAPLSIGSGRDLSVSESRYAVDNPDDSDDEPARATLVLLKSGRSSFFAPMNTAFIIARGTMKRRRHLYGNARVIINQSHSNPARSLSHWYQQIFRPLSSVPITPTLPASAWEYTCAILYYTPAPSNPSQGPPIKGYLRILRCPVDYAAPGNIPAIYGVAHPEPMFCRHDDWSHKTAWDGGPCARLRFTLGGSISPATDGAWDSLVLADYR